MGRDAFRFYAERVPVHAGHTWRINQLYVDAVAKRMGERLYFPRPSSFADAYGPDAAPRFHHRYERQGPALYGSSCQGGRAASLGGGSGIDVAGQSLVRWRSDQALVKQ